MKEHKLFFPDSATEWLRVTPLTQGRYRLENTSLSDQGLFYHDIIETKSRLGRGLCFLRLVERSGLRVYRSLLPEAFVTSEPFAAFLRRVEAHSGHWEQIFGGFLLIHLPRDSTCRPKSELRAILQAQQAAPA